MHKSMAYLQIYFGILLQKECSDRNIEFTLQKLMTHPSLQMSVERLRLSFLVSRD